MCIHLDEISGALRGPYLLSEYNFKWILDLVSSSYGWFKIENDRGLASLIFN